MAEKRTSKHSQSKAPKPYLKTKRQLQAGKNGLYIRSDSTEFITKYIEPELCRIYGKTALRSVGDIELTRSMTVPEADGSFTDLYMGVERVKADVPFSVNVSITERRLLSDEEVLVSWPYLEAVGMADDMKEAMAGNAAHILEIDNDYIAESFEEHDALLMQRQADIVMETDLDEEQITANLFDSHVSKFVRRSLALQRRKRPQLSFQTGFIYNGDEYWLRDGGWTAPTDTLLGETPNEMMLFADTLIQAHHSVEHDDSSDFIDALFKLGFRK